MGCCHAVRWLDCCIPVMQQPLLPCKVGTGDMLCSRDDEISFACHKHVSIMHNAVRAVKLSSPASC